MSLDTFFWMSGAAMWAVIACILTIITLFVLWGLVCAISFTRWLARANRRRGTKVTAWMIFTGSLRQWSYHIGHVNNGANKSTLNCGSIWRGIGDYTEF